MLQLFPIDCTANVNGGNNSFSVDDWNYVVVVKATGNVTIKPSGGEPIGPLTQALGMTLGQKQGKGVIQITSDVTETVVIAFSGDGSRITGFATGGIGAAFTNPLPITGKFPSGTLAAPAPVVIGAQNLIGDVQSLVTDDNIGLDVLQYSEFNQGPIAGAAAFSFTIKAAAMVLVTFEVTGASVSGAVTVSISGILKNGATIIQPQILDLNRTQVLSGAAKFVSGVTGSINLVGDRVAFLIPGDCLRVIVGHVNAALNDGVVMCTISASPLGAK